MKKTINLLFLLIIIGVCSQQVHLTEAKTYHKNSDKFLYSLENSDTINSEYLGTVEVFQPFKDEINAFDLFYKKAKSIGANSFSLISKKNIDGNLILDSHVFLYKLYYTQNIETKKNVFFLIGDPTKKIKIKINNKLFYIQPKTFLKKELNPGEIQEISVGGFLGSTVKLSYKENQNSLYLKAFGQKISENNNSTGGVNFKSGDIITIERSFAEFLISIYNKNFISDFQ